MTLQVVGKGSLWPYEDDRKGEYAGRRRGNRSGNLRLFFCTYITLEQRPHGKLDTCMHVFLLSTDTPRHVIRTQNSDNTDKRRAYPYTLLEAKYGRGY